MSHITQLPTSKSFFLAKHPIFGEKRLFSDWTTLCEHTLDLATQNIEELFEPQVKLAICALADEMIETAEEYEPSDAEIIEILHG